MGVKDINKFTSSDEKRKFTRHLLNDIKALEKMLELGLFEKDVLRIGAEQELQLIGDDWKPAMTWDKMLSQLDDEFFTTELAQFNIEMNLSPQKFGTDCLSLMEKQLKYLLKKVKKAGEQCGTKYILTGILPTVSKAHLDFDFMTPNPRYKALNDIMREQKGEDFEIVIRGVDELATRHPNILFEACNTSFQVHLQIKAEDFVEQYNWAQLISAPVLAVSANSPLLMGRRLWHENRIAVFEQSIDLRNREVIHRDIQPRVSFGRSWLKDSAANIFKDNVSRFNLLFATEIEENSLEKIEKGEIPGLDALRLHNGTIYSWNRPCYGISDTGKPHLRIENRYLPSGPTVEDEMANAAFWLGLMKGMPEEYKGFEDKIPFEDVRYNFYRAAQASLDVNIEWFNKTHNVRKLIKNIFMPIAENGLLKMQVNPKDIYRYLEIIQARLIRNTNGSKWIIKNYSNLRKTSTPFEASMYITQKLYENEISGKLLHEWEDIDLKESELQKKFDTAEQVMLTDIPTVQEDDSLELALNIMEWRNVRYVAVENFRHELVGLITSRRILRFVKDNWDENKTVKEIMVKKLVTVLPTTSTAETIKIMVDKGIGCLPVLSSKNRLLGLITERSLLTISHQLKKF